jgi:hypothetical protein
LAAVEPDAGAWVAAANAAWGASASTRRAVQVIVRNLRIGIFALLRPSGVKPKWQYLPGAQGMEGLPPTAFHRSI